MLRDGRSDTYWQSDGTAPHIVNVQFPRRMVLTVREGMEGLKHAPGLCRGSETGEGAGTVSRDE
jgi:hypothetical protein